MAEPIGALRAELSATAAQFEKDMGRARAALGITKQSFEAMKGAALLASTAIAATVTAFAAIAKSTADAGDEIAKMSRQIGMSAQDFSALRDAMDINGVSSDQFQTAMRTLSARMNDAAQGSAEAKQTFDALGIAVQKADGSLRPLQQVTLEIADRFAAMTDETRRAAMAQDAFGRGGLAMINGLEGGSKAIRGQMEESKALGRVWTEEMVRASELFNDNLTRLGWALDGIKLAIGNALIPTLNELSGRIVALAKSDEFRQWVQRMSDGLSTFAKMLLEELPTALKYAMAALRAFGTLVLAEAAGVLTLANAILQLNLIVYEGGLAIRELLGINESFGVTTDDVRKKVDSLTASIQKNRETIALLSKGMQELAFGAFPTLPEAAPATSTSMDIRKTFVPPPLVDKKSVEETKRLLEQGQKDAVASAQAIIDENFREAQALAKIWEDYWAHYAEMQQKDAAGWVAHAEAIMAQSEAEAQALATIQQNYWQDRDATAKALRDQELSNELESMKVEQEAWQYHWDFVAKQAADAREKIAAGVNEIFQPLARAFSGMVQGVLQGTQTLEDGFRKMGQNIAAALMETVIDNGLKLIAKALTDFATSMSNSGGGSWGSILASVFQAIGSSASARAGGGSVFAGQSYMVGERGPELFVPRTGGEIIPNGQFGGGAAVINIDARGSQRGVSTEIMAAIRTSMNSAVKISLARVQDERRRGGMRGLDR